MSRICAEKQLFLFFHLFRSSKDCQVADWKARHKKLCKKSSRPVQPKGAAMQAARSMKNPALRSQDDFLLSNPHIDYRIVLPSGSQDVGVVFPHPMGKHMFSMWRSLAPEPPYVNRMYDMLIESQPNRKGIIRKQLMAEYGVDPISDEAKKTTDETVPTGQQIVDSLGPGMIFYPENPLKPGEIPSGGSVRGTVGHEQMFSMTLGIYEGRLQKSWSELAGNGRPRCWPWFEELTPIILALLDAGIAQKMNKTYREESSTLGDNEQMLKLQLATLKSRLNAGGESFLFIPLEPYYLNTPHAIVKGIVDAMLGNQGALAERIKEGYTNVQFWTHKKGPWVGSRPPDSDLLGPHSFRGGLRLQCGMTPTLAVMLIYMLVKASRVTSASEVFVFPHALVFASANGKGEMDDIVKKVSSVIPTVSRVSIVLWRTAGRDCTLDNKAIKYVGKAQFIEMVRKMGCSWYPLFSDDANSSLFRR